MQPKTEMTRLAPSLLTFCLFAAPAWAAAPKSPDRDLSREKNLYVLNYAHLDTQWRWIYPQTIREYIPNTLRQNFPLFEKYPSYVFTFTGSRRYEFMKEYYPEDYAQLKRWVAEGRWFPGGSSVDENDAIVPSLESYVRHALYGNGFFEREFGVSSREFMLPDCFGFPAALPSILAHNGILGFITQKLTWGSAVGIPFKIGHWEGPDGKSVLAALDAGNYNKQVSEDLSQSEHWKNRIALSGSSSGLYVDMLFNGVGDVGGSPGAKSAEALERSVSGTGPVRVHSKPSDQLFLDLQKQNTDKLPRYKGEMLLVEHSAGSITSQAYMKRWNRKNELLAHAAEAAASTASWLGGLPYPREPLYRAWDLVLGSQMHDILPGTSLPKAYDLSWNDEVLALNQFADILQHSVAAISPALDTTAQGVPLIVYNPLSIEREDLVEATIPLQGAVAVFDPEGRPVPTQILRRNKDAVTILFPARVPGLGYACFDARPAASESVVAAGELRASEQGLENALYRVSVDAKGDIASIFDKRASRELLRAPARLAFLYENPRHYPAWNMDWEDRKKPPLGFVDGPAKIRVLESGPVRVCLEIEREARGSKFVQQVRLGAGGAGGRLEVVNKIDWRSPGVSLKAAFPFVAANASATYDAQVGTVSRTNNRPKQYEVPQHQWIDLTNADGKHGVAVLNDSKFGSDKPEDHTLRLTLLYTPHVRNKYQDQASQDFGRHEMVYAVTSHDGDWKEVPWQAARLNQPLIPFVATSHPGPLGKRFGLLSLDHPQVQICAVKIAEQSDELIVRVRELTGKPATGVSLGLGAASIARAREVNGQEKEIGPATVRDGKLSFELSPYTVRAFAIALPAAPAKLAAPSSVPVNLPFDTVAATTDQKRGAADFDGKGGSYPAEMLPQSLERNGVRFVLGPADGKNALKARGQSIALPAGEFNRVQILAASSESDVAASLGIGGTNQPFTAQAWTGYIGQWDKRLWDGVEPERAYYWENALAGLVPGYIKRAPVAWFATHHHTPKTNVFYQFSYLFNYAFELPKGATSLTLPNDERIRLFAIAAVKDPGAGVRPAAPLYDTLQEHRWETNGAPEIVAEAGGYNDAAVVRVVPPLYYRPGDLRYTLDGSQPSVNSPVCNGTLTLHRSATLKVCQVREDGTLGPLVTAEIRVEDRVAPSLVSVKRIANDRVELLFSEPVQPETAAANYRFTPALPLKSAELAPDGRRLTLTFGRPLEARTELLVEKVADRSPAANTARNLSAVLLPNLAFQLPSATLPAEAFSKEIPELPLGSTDSWTMHVFIKPSAGSKASGLIAGFGSAVDDHAGSGQGRYLALVDDKIRFWSDDNELETNSPLPPGQWQLLSVTYDGGKVALYKNGKLIKRETLTLADDPVGRVALAPAGPWKSKAPLAAELRQFTLLRHAASAEEIKAFEKANAPAP